MSNKTEEEEVDYRQHGIHKCVRCGEVKVVIFFPDEYLFQTQGDDTPLWICKACRGEV